MPSNISAKGCILAIATLSLLLAPATAIVDEWTPAGFDWETPRKPHLHGSELSTGLWMNMSAVPHTTDISMMSVTTNNRTLIANHEFIAIIPFLGLAFQAASLVAAGISLKNTINTCKQTVGTFSSIYKCAEGVFTTLVSFGGAYSASKILGTRAGRALLPHRFPENGPIDLSMNILTRRGLDQESAEAQLVHNFLVRHHLRSMSHPEKSEPEFLGYADDDHRFAKREFGSHPLVPLFRFEHFKYGSMEMATRDTLNGTFMSLAPTGHPTHLLGRKRQLEYIRKAKRDEYYRYEDISGGAVEARFDAGASMADPADIQADAGDLFNTFEPEVECFMGESYPDGNVLSVQMYDQTNRATFGFGSLGIYNSEGDADSIENFTPYGQPLPECGS